MPFGEGTINAYIDTSSGSLVFELGELDEPDAVMMTDYETARALLVDRDPAIAMQSFMAGKIRVQGDMMKLMAMQTAMPSNEFSEQVADEIAAITSVSARSRLERLHRARASASSGHRVGCSIDSPASDHGSSRRTVPPCT